MSYEQEPPISLASRLEIGEINPAEREILNGLFVNLSKLGFPIFTIENFDQANGMQIGFWENAFRISKDLSRRINELNDLLAEKAFLSLPEAERKRIAEIRFRAPEDGGITEEMGEPKLVDIGPDELESLLQDREEKEAKKISSSKFDPYTGEKIPHYAPEEGEYLAMVIKIRERLTASRRAFQEAYRLQADHGKFFSVSARELGFGESYLDRVKGRLEA